MTFDEYQKESRKTAIYPSKGYGIDYVTLGLVGEAGEVAEKVKKVLRDDNGQISEEKRKEIKKELGDILWYIAQMATDLGFDLDEVAKLNLDKTKSRQARNKLSGSGDER